MELKPLAKKEILNPIFKQQAFAWFVFSVTFVLMLIDNFLKMDDLVGAWHMVLYFLLMTPLAYMVYKGKVVNPYTKWFFPVLLVMIWSMFYYSNEMVQYLVPLFFYVLLITLYLTSGHQVHSFYQILVPRVSFPWNGMDYILEFFSHLFLKNDENKIYGRIGVALLITVPFLVLFLFLLFWADKNFAHFIVNYVDCALGIFSLSLFVYLWTLLSERPKRSD